MSIKQPPVGIDLGTTFSVVSYLDSAGNPHTVQNAEGDLTTPSVVYFGEHETVVGKEAVKVAQFEPQSIAQFAKRDVGKSQFHKVIRGCKLPPEAIQALILQKLRQDARLKIGDFDRVVITVPAFFNEPRRKATMDAGKLAGLDVIDIINEPTAAAIAYGVQEGFVSDAGESQRRETIVVYDLGGGTFDVTLMEIDGQNYKARATGGDVYLGGIDWDERIVDHLAEAFQEMHHVDPRRSPEALQVLRHEAEDAKRALSTRESVVIHFAHAGQRLKTELTRAQFESLTEDLLQRTIFTVSKVLREGKRSWQDVTRLLLVGGSTRMPMIPAALQQESGLDPDRSLSPDEAVAEGAALYAGFLTNPNRAGRLSMRVTNISSHDLGVMGVEPGTGLKRRHVIIRRNTALPAQGASQFSTRRENQENVKIEVVEGGDASGQNSTAIGKCIVTDLPPKLPAGSPVFVKFKYGTNGRLTVEASLATASQQATMVVERASGLSDRMIQQWTQWLNSGARLEPAQQDDATAATVAPAPADEQPAQQLPGKQKSQSRDKPAGVLDQIEEVEFEDDVAGLDFEDESDAPDFLDDESLNDGSSDDEEYREAELIEDEIAQTVPTKPAKPPKPAKPAKPTQQVKPVKPAPPTKPVKPAPSLPQSKPVDGPAGLDALDDSQMPAPKKRGEAPSDWSFLDGP